jgi:hypothetical protein
MVTAKNGITEQVSMSSDNPAAYPLTMVIYAMVPTRGITQAKANLIARWLRYVAGPGQDPGRLPGHLPPGYLPLPRKMRAETLAVARTIQQHAGTVKPPARTPTTATTSTTPATSTTVSPNPGGSLTPSPSATATISLPPVHPRLTTVAVRDPQSVGMIRYALPVVLILGGLATLGGAAALIGGSDGAAAAMTRLRRRSLARIKRRRRP